jgi:hypothetical protein
VHANRVRDGVDPLTISIRSRNVQAGNPWMRSCAMASFSTGLHHVATQSAFGWPAIAVAVGMGAYLNHQGASLKPPGIISFELAFTTSKARAIVGGWAGLLDIAAKQVRCDYVFIFGYACSLLFICFRAADYASHRGHADLASLAEFAGYGALLAGLLDGIENGGLLLMLAGRISTLIVLVTSLCATVKFVLAFAAIPVACAVAGWSWWSPAQS